MLASYLATSHGLFFYGKSRHYVEQLCLRHGTSLEGAYEASGAIFKNILQLHATYLRPFLVGGKDNLILMPIYSISRLDNAFLNVNAILNGTALEDAELRALLPQNLGRIYEKCHRFSYYIHQLDDIFE